MAEEHVSRDQHRADLTELRGELRDELAGLRQDMAVLAKTVEALAQEMRQGFGQVDRRLDEQRQNIQELRREIRDEMRAWRQSTTHQMWTTISVVLFAVLGGLIKLVFFP